MKALSIAQPWAHLLVSGVKKYETRPWRTNHRGPLLIHACGRLAQAERELCAQQPLRGLLRALGFSRPSQLPLGVIIGAVEVIDCIDVEDVIEEVSDQERALGDFRPGRWAWRLGKRRVLAAPLACRGHRGLFEVARKREKS